MKYLFLDCICSITRIKLQTASVGNSKHATDMFKLTLKMLPLKLANTKVYFDFEDDTFFYLLQSLFVCK